MANDSPQNDTPQNLPYIPIGVDGVVEVRGHLVGSSLIDGLRRIFATDSQMEQGDYHMDRSVDLLYRHLQLMALKDQNAIRHRFLKSVFNVLCCAAESLKCDTPAYQGAGSQTGFILRRLQWLFVPKVLGSQTI